MKFKACLDCLHEKGYTSWDQIFHNTKDVLARFRRSQLKRGERKMSGAQELQCRNTGQKQKKRHPVSKSQHNDAQVCAGENRIKGDFNKTKHGNCNLSLKHNAHRHGKEEHLPMKTACDQSSEAVLRGRKPKISQHTLKRKYQQTASVVISKSKVTDAFKAEVVRYALKVAHMGRGIQVTREARSLARKYKIAPPKVHHWLKYLVSGCVRISKSNVADVLKANCICYGSGHTPAHDHECGSSQATVSDWLNDHNDPASKIGKRELNHAFKSEVVHYALDVACQGIGGTRGVCAASRKYGVSRATVRSWINKTEQSSITTSESKVTDALKAVVIQYALEVVFTAQGGKYPKRACVIIPPKGTDQQVHKASVPVKLNALLSNPINNETNNNLFAPAAIEGELDQSGCSINFSGTTEGWSQELDKTNPEISEQNDCYAGFVRMSEQFSSPLEAESGMTLGILLDFLFGAQNPFKSEDRPFKSQILERVSREEGKQPLPKHAESKASKSSQIRCIEEQVGQGNGMIVSSTIKVTREKYTDGFKKEVVRYALEVVPQGKGHGSTRGTHEAARKYGIDRKSVRSWLNDSTSSPDICTVKTISAATTKKTSRAQISQHSQETCQAGNKDDLNAHLNTNEMQSGNKRGRPRKPPSSHPKQQVDKDVLKNESGLSVLQGEITTADVSGNKRGRPKKPPSSHPKQQVDKDVRNESGSSVLQGEIATSNVSGNKRGRPRKPPSSHPKQQVDKDVLKNEIGSSALQGEIVIADVENEGAAFQSGETCKDQPQLLGLLVQLKESGIERALYNDVATYDSQNAAEDKPQDSEHAFNQNNQSSTNNELAPADLTANPRKLTAAENDPQGGGHAFNQTNQISTSDALTDADLTASPRKEFPTKIV